MDFVDVADQKRWSRRTSWVVGYCYGSSAFRYRSLFRYGCLVAFTA